MIYDFNESMAEGGGLAGVIGMNFGGGGEGSAPSTPSVSKAATLAAPFLRPLLRSFLRSFTEPQ